MLVGAEAVCAADGDLDLSFGDLGKHVAAFDLGGKRNDIAAGVAVGPGNLVYLAGTVQGATSTPHIGLVRLLSSGLPDNGFGVNGKRSHAMTDFVKLGLSAVAMQPDGKLVVAGTADRHGGMQTDFDLLVCRFQSDGNPDLAFGNPKTPGCGPVSVNWIAKGADSASSVRIQPDGGILVAGQAAIEDGRTAGVLARLTSKGALDDTFGQEGMVVFDELTVTPGSRMVLSDLAIGPDGFITTAGLDVMFLGFLDFVLLADGLQLC